MMSEIGDALVAAIPPADGSDAHIYRWRLIIALLVVMTMAGLGTHIALACGFLPSIFSGFASASEVADQGTQIVQIQLSQIDAKIIDTRERQCKAIKSNNDDAKQFATDRLGDELRLYLKLSGSTYRLPGCDEL